MVQLSHPANVPIAIDALVCQSLVISFTEAFLGQPPECFTSPRYFFMIIVEVYP